MPMRSLHELFIETLKDIYYAEQQMLKALPQLAERASSVELKEVIGKHVTQTADHVRRIEAVFTAMRVKAVARRSEAFEGILREAHELIGEVDDEHTIDVAIIAAAQTIEHYEIARYGTLVSWARQLGLEHSRLLLHTTLHEEKAADGKLSGLAEEHLNQRAAP